MRVGTLFRLLYHLRRTETRTVWFGNLQETMRVCGSAPRSFNYPFVHFLSTNATYDSTVSFIPSIRLCSTESKHVGTVLLVHACPATYIALLGVLPGFIIAI